MPALPRRRRIPPPGGSAVDHAARRRDDRRRRRQCPEAPIILILSLPPHHARAARGRTATSLLIRRRRSICKDRKWRIIDGRGLVHNYQRWDVNLARRNQRRCGGNTNDPKDIVERGAWSQQMSTKRRGITIISWGDTLDRKT